MLALLEQPMAVLHLAHSCPVLIQSTAVDDVININVVCSDEYYKQEPWPAAEVIASQCGNDELFLFFYK
jgi:hypothetical protein